MNQEETYCVDTVEVQVHLFWDCLIHCVKGRRQRYHWKAQTIVYALLFNGGEVVGQMYFWN